MKDMYEKIQSDEWRGNTCELKFSCPEIVLSPARDELAEGSFAIYCEPGCMAEGYVSCREERMECLTPRFSGSAESIAYRFDTSGMREGEECSGHFLIISDQGEYELPYRVRIARRELVCSGGVVENLFQFTTLARNNWGEAVRLFYSQDFMRLINSSDRKYRNLYKGLSRYSGNEQNMEEFLVAAGQKQAVEFLLPTREVVVNVHPVRLQEEQLCETVRISRNGWGYTRLSVRCESDFLTTEKKMLREEDFLGNQCVLPVFIDPEKLREGKNFGKVVLCFSGRELVINVTVIREREHRFAKTGRRMEMKRLMVDLVKLYQDYKMKKMSAAAWRTGTADVIERMKRLDEHAPEIRLYQVQLLMTENRVEEAGRILRDLKVTPKGNGPEVYCYYLYLSSMYSQEEGFAAEAQLQIEELHRRFPDSWRISWLMCYLSPSLRSSVSQKWIFLEEQFRRGAVSPVLYLEALQLANNTPTLMMKLGSYEMQLLHFGARNDFLSSDLMGHVVYLAGKEKYYSEPLLSILKVCYEKQQDKETLNAICALLIKGNKVGEEYLNWYRLGVEKELRVTRLYDYYMMSVDPEGEEEIPRVVLMYFAYQSNLEAEQCALLYAYVLRHREEFPELYLAYRGQMERFVLQQLSRGKTGKKLALLYAGMPENGMLTAESAQLLAPLLFVQQVDCADPAVRRVVVLHTRLRGEQVYPVEGKKAFVAVYDRDYEIFLEDEEQNRYSVSREYTLTQLISPERCVEAMKPWVEKETGFDLYCCESRKGKVTVTEETADRFRHLAENEQILPAFSRAIRMALLQYYHEKEDTRALDILLERLDREETEASDIPQIAELLVKRSFYEKAYAWLEGVAPERISESILLRLCSRLLENGLYITEKRMMALAVSAFQRGKYDSRILEYLASSMTGSVKELLEVRAASENFELDTYPVTQRLLVQLLFIGDDVTNRMDLLRAYVAEGGKSELIAAFLHRCCGLFLMEGKPMQPYVLSTVSRMSAQGESLSDMCELAFLEYYSRHRDERSAGIDETIRQFGEQLIRRDIKLPLFREYADILEGVESLLDKTMIVFKGDRGCPVSIHYRVCRMDEWNENTFGERSPQAVSSLEMQHVYAGIYTASFVLFAGESLQYYITRSSDGYLGEKLDSGELRMGEIGGFMKESRYGRINEVAASWLMGEKDASQELLEQYLYTEWMVDGLFDLNDTEKGNGR